MQLYLLRHADADTEAERDDDRRLSEKGHEQAERMAGFCAAQGVQPEVVLTSPLVRARETAVHVAEEIGAELVVLPWLASGMQPAEALDKLSAFRQRKSVMIVGHEPDFSSFIAFCLGLPSRSLVHVRKASLTLLEIDVFRPGTARLEFLIPCKLT